MQLVTISNDELPKTPRRSRKSKSPERARATDQMKMQIQELQTELSNSKIALDEKQQEFDEKIQLYNQRFKDEQTEIQQLTLLSDQRELDNDNLERLNTEQLEEIEQHVKEISKLHDDINEQQSDFNMLVEQQKQKYDSEREEAAKELEELKSELGNEERQNIELASKTKKYKQQFQEKHKEYQQFSEKMKERFNEREVELIETEAELKQQLIEKQYEITQKIIEPPNSREMMSLQLENQTIKLKLEAIQQQHRIQLERMKDGQKLSYFKLNETHSSVRREQNSKIQELEEVNEQLRKSIDELEATYSNRLTLTRQELSESKQALMEHNEQFFESQRMLQSEALLMTGRLNESQMAETEAEIGNFKEREKAFRTEMTALKRNLAEMQQDKERLEGELKVAKIEIGNAEALYKSQITAQKQELSQEFLEKLNEARSEVIRLRDALKGSHDQHDALLAESQLKTEEMLAKEQNELELRDQQFDMQLRSEEATFKQSLGRLREENANLLKEVQQLKGEIFELKAKESDRSSTEVQHNSALVDGLKLQIADLKDELRGKAERHDTELREEQAQEKRKIDDLMKHNTSLTAEIRKQELSYEEQTQELRILFKAKELNLQRFYEEQKAKERAKLESELNQKTKTLEEMAEELEEARDIHTSALAEHKRELQDERHEVELQQQESEHDAKIAAQRLDATEERIEQLLSRVESAESMLNEALEKQKCLSHTLTSEEETGDEAMKALHLENNELKAELALERLEMQKQLTKLQEDSEKEEASARLKMIDLQAEISRIRAECDRELLEMEEELRLSENEITALTENQELVLQKLKSDHLEALHEAEYCNTQLKQSSAADIEALKAEHEEKSLEASQHAAELQREVIDLEEQVLELEKTLEERQHAIEMAEIDAKEQLETENSEFERRLLEIEEESEAELAGKEEEIAALKRDQHVEKNNYETALRKLEFSKQAELEKVENRAEMLQTKMHQIEEQARSKTEREMSSANTQFERQLREKQAEYESHLLRIEKENEALQQEMERLEQQQEQVEEMATMAREDAKKQSEYYLSLLVQRRKELEAKDDEIAALNKQYAENSSALRLEIAECAGKGGAVLAEKLQEVASSYEREMEEQYLQSAELRRELARAEDAAQTQVDKVMAEMQERLIVSAQEYQQAAAKLEEELDQSKSEVQHYKGLSETLQNQLDRLSAERGLQLEEQQRKMQEIVERMREEVKIPDESLITPITESLTAQFERRQAEIGSEIREIEQQTEIREHELRDSYEARIVVLADELAEAKQESLAERSISEIEVEELTSKILSLEQQSDRLHEELSRQREELSQHYAEQHESLKRQTAQFMAVSHNMASSSESAAVSELKTQLRLASSELAASQVELQRVREQLNEAAVSAASNARKYREQLRQTLDERERAADSLQLEIGALRQRAIETDELVSILREKLSEEAQDALAARERLADERSRSYLDAERSEAQMELEFVKRHEERQMAFAEEKSALLNTISGLEDRLRASEEEIAQLRQGARDSERARAEEICETEKRTEAAVAASQKALELQRQHLEEDFDLRLRLRDQAEEVERERHAGDLAHANEAYKLEISLLGRQMQEESQAAAERHAQELASVSAQVAQYIEEAEAAGARIANMKAQMEQQEADAVRRLAQKQSLIDGLLARQDGAAGAGGWSLSAEQELKLRDVADNLRLLRTKIEAMRGKLIVTLPDPALIERIVRLSAAKPPTQATQAEYGYFESRLAAVKDMARSTVASYVSEVAVATTGLKQLAQLLLQSYEQSDEQISRLEAAIAAIRASFSQMRKDSEVGDERVAELFAELENLLGGDGKPQIDTLQENWLSRSAKMDAELTASRIELERAMADTLQMQPIAQETCDILEQTTEIEQCEGPPEVIERLIGCNVGSVEPLLQDMQDRFEMTLSTLSDRFTKLLDEVFDYFQK